MSNPFLNKPPVAIGAFAGIGSDGSDLKDRRLDPSLDIQIFILEYGEEPTILLEIRPVPNPPLTARERDLMKALKQLPTCAIMSDDPFSR